MSNRVGSPSLELRSTSTAEQQQQRVQIEAQERIRQAINARGNGVCSGPSLLERISRMGSDEITVARVLRAVEEAPANHRPPLVVECIEAVLAGAPLRGDPAPRTPQRDELAAELEKIDRLMERVIDPDTLQSLREDRARFEDENAQRQRGTPRSISEELRAELAACETVCSKETSMNGQDVAAVTQSEPRSTQ